MSTLFTIGHSTRTLEEFVTVLQAHSIDILVDIRSFPMSKRLPHFNHEQLDVSLPENHIRYVWLRELGGRRPKSLAHSPNTALRNQSFRNYADYMMTVEFHRGISELLSLAEQARVAYMCAERVYFHCHRMLVSDYLVARGHEVLHIDGAQTPKAHMLMQEAHLQGEHLIYSGGTLF